MKNKLSLFLLAALTIVGLSACAWRSNPLADKEQQFGLTGARRQQVLDQIDQRYYYQQLSQAEKENYLLLYDSLSAFHEVTSLAPASKHSLMTTIDAFMMDNPAFFGLPQPTIAWNARIRWPSLPFHCQRRSNKPITGFKPLEMISSLTCQQPMTMSA